MKILSGNAVRGRNFTKSIFIDLQSLTMHAHGKRKNARQTLFPVREIDSSRKLKQVQIH